jgi:hypothetical protein
VIGAITAGLYGTGVPPVTNSYESIATVTVGSGGSSSVEFTSIPQTYKHLQIRIMARTNRSVAADNVSLTFNGDALGGTNYAYHFLSGDGASVSAGGGSSFERILAANVAGATSTANVFGVGVLDILDYTNTNKNTTTRSLTGYDANGSGNSRLYSGLYLSTTAITSIKLWAEASSLHTQYSSFALYGIKG